MYREEGSYRGRRERSFIVYSIYLLIGEAEIIHHLEIVATVLTSMS